MGLPLFFKFITTMKNLFTALFILIATSFASAQNAGYWQQHVDYKMDVNVDAKKFQYTGNQELVYTNNSSDTLYKVYYHLYLNAFQPGSEMDMRLRNISDPDRRMVTTTTAADGTKKYESKIKHLKPNEIGYLKVKNLKQDGAAVATSEHGTILEVTLAKPLMPNAKTTLEMEFEGQIPVQIRRTGRNNSEGVALSMAQWYPKMAEYDFEGWHANPYIGREFHGVWGDFDVSITIDKNYILGGTGYIQNNNEVGYGYEDVGVKMKKPKNSKTLTWHFVAPMVHDFTWAADPDYIHDKVETESGTTLHFLYKNDSKILQNWKNLQPKAVELLSIFNQLVGKYPYKQYSIIQGGDGGMEYAMCTLILGGGTMEGLLGVTAHEMAHAWFQGVLASNETAHGWMDEGFTTFIEDFAMDIVNKTNANNPFEGSYNGYRSLANSGLEQSQGTHADRYSVNRSYSIASYHKGSIFLSQLIYLIGFENLVGTLQQFYKEFQFKHPTPNDLIRTAEKISGAHLGWYLTDWTRTTNSIDYSITSVKEKDGNSQISLQRKGLMPMPLDILVTYADGSVETFYIPLRMMYFSKENPYQNIKRTVLPEMTWADPNYTFKINKPLKKIAQIVLDPSGLMADIKPEDNIYPSTKSN